MKKAIWCGAAVAAVVCLLLIVWFTRNREPTHKGKPARYWREVLKSGDPAAKREAITALGALKVKDVFPDMLAALSDKDSQTRAKAAEAIWSMGGAHAKDAVPALVTL